ncbi:MAG: stress response translation initiation inhibitor YciH [Planctomycetota bacterium]
MSRVVWDSDQGRMCPRCRKAMAQCRCGEELAPPAGDGVVRVRREVRNGKTLTVVLGVPLRKAELQAFGKQLKQRCGTGGTVKDGAIELQGDHREQVVAFLQQQGHTVKLAGG